MWNILFGALFDGLPLIPFAVALVWTLRYQKVADLSLAGSFSIASAVAFSTIQTGGNVWFGIALGIAAGMAVGAAMAAAYNLLKIDSLLSGLVVLFISYALSLSITQGTIPIARDLNPMESLLEIELGYKVATWIHPLINTTFILASSLVVLVSIRLLSSEWGCAFRALEDTKGGPRFLMSLGLSPTKLSFSGFLIAAFCSSASGILVALRDGQTTSSLGVDSLIEIIPAYLLGLTLLEKRPTLKSYQKSAERRQGPFGRVHDLALQIQYRLRFAPAPLAASFGVILFFVIINAAQHWASMPWLPRVFIGIILLLILGLGPAIESYIRDKKQKAATRIVAPTAALEISGLTVSYPTATGGVTVLNGFGMKAMPGEVVKIVGGNGSGKTTLLRALTDQIDCDGNFVIPVRSGAERIGRRMSLIAYVPQDASTQLSSALTVAEHAALARRELDVSIFRPWQRGVEMGSKDMMIDDVIPTRDIPLGFLSGGQTRRVLLGLIAIRPNAPVVIALDEPFSYLDEAGQAHCRNFIRRQQELSHVTILVDHGNQISSVRPQSLLCDRGVLPK